MKRPRLVGVAVATLLLAYSPQLALASGTTFSAHLNGKDVVPSRPTNATAEAKFFLGNDGTQLQYRVNVGNIENVVRADIHIGAPGANGEIVATLYGPVPAGGGKKTGILASGTIMAASLVGSLSGRPLSDLISAMKAGNVYVDISTDDGNGVPDQKPGDFSTGEVRGQVK